MLRAIGLEVARLVRPRLSSSRAKEQMNAFWRDSARWLPLNLNQDISTSTKLELLMCGIQTSTSRTETDTLYKGDYHANHVVIQWVLAGVCCRSTRNAISAAAVGDGHFAVCR
ncbi:hypothetical protein LSTR_LSTR017189 [Laodelphax striatellus]|uniref:Uncharacterized protein n=1 Tax=Laodelphax striatellus TaxID=195883 RepID=A0A482XJI6_LAOST|nr:hypothetical protein LSTR_LSTR017189 [Laodelphax striatellus]